jgi:hypothetical protein
MYGFIYIHNTIWEAIYKNIEYYRAGYSPLWDASVYEFVAGGSILKFRSNVPFI